MNSFCAFLYTLSQIVFIYRLYLHWLHRYSHTDLYYTNCTLWIIFVQSLFTYFHIYFMLQYILHVETVYWNFILSKTQFSL